MFNADPRVLGTTVTLGKDPFTVIGVAPARFHGTDRFVWPDYWIPILNYFERDYLEDRTGRPLAVLGRLKPGVTTEQATENLKVNKDNYKAGLATISEVLDAQTAYQQASSTVVTAFADFYVRVAIYNYVTAKTEDHP